MTRAEARNSINRIVSFYHEDSGGHISGRVLDLSADDSECLIQCGQQQYVVPIEDIHEGEPEEVFASAESFDDTLDEEDDEDVFDDTLDDEE